MVMINDVLLSVRNRIESALQAAQARDEEWIRLTNLTGLDGAVQPDIAGRIVMSLAALQHDTSLSSYQPVRASGGDNYAISSAPQFIDAYVLLAVARRAGGAPLARVAQWECILAASSDRHPVPRLTNLMLDGAEGVPPPPAPARARIEALLSASLEGMRDAPLRIALDLRERDRRPRADARPENPEAPASAIHIANAGLVLVSAFLPRLFQSLDYVVPAEGGELRWSDGECRGRAVHLLQWLVDMRTDAPEPQLALNKILCGMAVAEPVSAEIILDDRELQMGGKLLATILANWPPLAESGIAALRETFFRREGRLTKSEQGWSLEVEARVLDILLDQLPWGFSTILHPWMPAPLTVQWR